MTDHAPQDDFQDDLKAYADGELAWPRRLAVRRHLTRCASCREELTQMTQIAEDLRASEPTDALDPALRAKILGIAPPATVDGEGVAGEEGRTQAPLRPTPPGMGGGGRKRPALAWVIAGAALVAWFLFFPLFQHTREAVPAAHMAQNEAPAASVARMPAAGPSPPPKPKPQFQVRLSDRESRTDKNGNVDGNVSLQIKNLGAVTRNATGDGLLNGTIPADSPAPQRQVHKEATIGVQVANPEATSDKVANMVKESGGFVAGNTLSTGDDGLKSAELTVKVPVVQFETFLGQVARLGSVQSKNITGEDITEKTSDADQTENVLESDVQNSEARLKALGAKAKWSDQQATRDLRTQLAESRARLLLLKRLAALSTITIDLSQTPKSPAPAPVTGGFLNGLKDSTHDALQSLVASAGVLVALVIWLLAYAPLWVPALLVGRYALREYRKRQVGT